jgi:streptogramin lyase
MDGADARLRPHDPLATHDGVICYSGQMADKLGRLDPASATIKRYSLPSICGAAAMMEGQRCGGTDLPNG